MLQHCLLRPRLDLEGCECLLELPSLDLLHQLEACEVEKDLDLLHLQLIPPLVG